MTTGASPSDSSNRRRARADLETVLKGLGWEPATIKGAPTQRLILAKTLPAPDPPPASAFQGRASGIVLGRLLGKGGMGQVHL